MIMDFFERAFSRKGGVSFFFFLIFIPSLFAQKGGEGKPGKSGGQEGKVINGFYDQKVFYHPKSGPYLETYITIDGKTLHYEKGKDGKARSKVRITSTIKRGDSVATTDTVVYRGPSPEGKKKVPNLVDVNRFFLDSGLYKVKIHLEDLNADTVKKFTIRSSSFVPHFDRDSVMFSDIQLLQSYQKTEKKDRYYKAGYRLIPYVQGIYPKELKKLKFYVELYNSDRFFADSAHFAVNYYIYDLDRHQKMKQFQGVKVEEPQDLIPYLISFDIDELSGGNYSLIFEVRNSDNEVVTDHAVYFQRKQPKQKRKESILAQKVEGSFVSEMNDMDSLRMYTRSLIPKADPVESDLIKNQVDVMDEETLKRFFYGFWVERNEKEPAKEWFQYKKLVDLVNERYGGTYQKGFETDRGRVMLQYGKPDRLVERKNKPHSYPYEIWQYYKIGQFSNKKFVFYDADLAGNDYRLLHSDMPGELKNRRWKRQLQDRQNIMDNVDQENPRQHYGREVDELFRNP